MTREEAKAIIRKEYLCVNRDCDIERSCGRCDLMMPSKEPILQAYKMAMDALEQEPSGDCISRQAALDCFTATKLKKFDFILYAREEIKKLPPVKPQTGHWIKMPLIEAGQTYSHKCSLCGRRILVTDTGLSEFPYCHCGARMESEDKE